jgi:hypothetical protein
MTNKKSVSLYNGEVKLDFYPDSHRYKLEGEKTYLISATTCTGMIDKSRFLIPWALNCGERYLLKYIDSVSVLTKEELALKITESKKASELEKEEAADIGSLVHAFAQAFSESKLNGTPTPEIPTDADPRIIAGINAFLDWYLQNDVKFIACEQVVYSRDHGYCGIFDVLAEVNGQKLIIDYKTSKAIYNEHRYQIAGYREAYEEEYGKIDGAMILHFDKETGEFNTLELTDEDHALDLPVFLACYTIKKRDKELTKMNGYKPE